MYDNTSHSKSEKIIIESYDKLLSVRAVSLETGYSWNRIVKALSSNGYILSETHAEILDKLKQGMSVKQIASGIGLNEKTVQAYVPRRRPLYNENPSSNALRIKKCRERKKN